MEKRKYKKEQQTKDRLYKEEQIEMRKKQTKVKWKQSTKKKRQKPNNKKYWQKDLLK
jgi:hypothetical protein